MSVSESVLKDYDEDSFKSLKQGHGRFVVPECGAKRIECITLMRKREVRATPTHIQYESVMHRTNDIVKLAADEYRLS